MQEAIKALEKAIEAAEQRLAYIKNASTRIEHSVAIHDEYTTYSDSAIQDTERITRELVEEYQSAIKILQRKVKKDPRVDGLPDDFRPLLLWKKLENYPIAGHYNPHRGEWVVFTSAKPYPTDDILFYCDSDDIL